MSRCAQRPGTPGNDEAAGGFAKDPHAPGRRRDPDHYLLQVEQARLNVASDLSVSIIRDRTIATRTKLAELTTEDPAIRFPQSVA